MLKMAVRCAVLVAAVSTGPVVAAADPGNWTPPGPIKLIIGFPAGGGVDTQARLIAQAMEDRYGWTVLPQQVPGNGGNNAALAVAKEPADGTALAIIVTETLGYNAIVAENPKLALENFTPLATTARFQMGLVARAGGEFDSWGKVKAASKAGKPIRLGVATPRIADVTYHLGLESGVDFNIVNFKGGAGVMNGINAGDLDLGWVAGVQSKYVKSGEMVNVLSGIPTPLVDSPDAPTLGKVGSKFYIDGYFVFVGPAGMDKKARAALAEAIAAIAMDPETKAGAMLARAFGGASAIRGDALEQYLAKDRSAAKKLLQAVSR